MSTAQSIMANNLANKKKKKGSSTELSSFWVTMTRSRKTESPCATVGTLVLALSKMDSMRVAATQSDTLTGLSLMVGLETHRYSLPSSWMQVSIRAWTELSSWNSRNAYPGRSQTYRLLSTLQRHHAGQKYNGKLLWHTFGWEIGLALCLVGPVNKQVTKSTETGCDFIW